MAPHRRTGPRLVEALLAALVAALLRALGASWRVRTEGPDPFRSSAPFVAALWHQGLFVAAGTFRDRGAVVPVSRSRDGERIARVLERLGFGPPPRGSSSRGGAAALAGMIRALREGRVVGVLCDGPRGPAGVAKPGALAAARAAGVPLVPVGFAARPAIRFGSWDRVVLPLPFARVSVVFGPPLEPPRHGSPEALETQRAALDRAIEAAQRRAEESLAGARSPDRAPEGARHP